MMLKIFSLLKNENTCGWHFSGTMEHDQNYDSNPTWHIRRLHVGPESRGSYLESTSRWGPTGFIFRKGGFQRPKAALIVVETKKEKLATAKFLFYFQFLVGPWVRFMIILDGMGPTFRHRPGPHPPWLLPPVRSSNASNLKHCVLQLHFGHNFSQHSVQPLKCPRALN